MKHLTHVALASALALAACSQEATPARSSEDLVAGGGADSDGTGRVAATAPLEREDVRGLVYARPFRLARGYQHEWRADPSWVSAGWLLVLEVDPDLVVPRQEYEPVLYGGEETVERVNFGHESGRVVAVLPSGEGPDGLPLADLAATTFFFGTPMLPEQVSHAQVRIETELAAARGAAPFDEDEVAAALAAGGGLLEAEDRTTLRRAAAELVRAYSPEETELAESILAPLVR